MFKTKKGLALALATTFALGAVSFASAEDVIKEVSAQINYGMKMSLNGQEFNPRDSDGSALRPLVYNGRSYLPVRALADALKTAVDYDDKTQTIILGERSKTLLDTNSFELRDIEYTSDTDKLFIKNKTYKNGFLVNQSGDAFPGYGDIYMTIDTQGKYQKLGFTFTTESDVADFKVIDLDNNEVLKTIDAAQGGKTQDFELDIKGAKKIQILSDSGQGARKYEVLKPTAFTNFYVK